MYLSIYLRAFLSVRSYVRPPFHLYVHEPTYPSIYSPACPRMADEYNHEINRTLDSYSEVLQLTALPANRLRNRSFKASCTSCSKFRKGRIWYIRWRSVLGTAFWNDQDRPVIQIIIPKLCCSMKNCVFCDITPCGSCKNRRFGGT
jgi:hypothetical protein